MDLYIQAYVTINCVPIKWKSCCRYSVILPDKSGLRMMG